MARPVTAGAARNRRGGFTLLEVVIALAIFVIGAIAIVRIFTPALGVIQNSGNQTIATRGSENVLARVNTRTLGAPDWVYNIYKPTDPDYDAVNPNKPNLNNVAFNGTANRNQSLPFNTLDVTGSALDSGKRIEGERQKVLNRAGGSNFVVTNFPYVGTVNVSLEEKIDGVRIDSAGYLNFGNATITSNGVSWAGTDGNSPLQTGNDYTYYISYNWVDNAGYIHGVIDEPYIFPGNFSDAAYGMVLQGRRIVSGSTDPLLPKNIVSGGIAVRVVKYCGTTTSPATNDDDFRGIASGDALDSATNTAGGTISPGDTVYLSYTAKDWRWMVDDDIPTLTSTAPPNQIRTLYLPIRGLGDNEGNQWLYSALTAAPSDNMSSIIYRDKWDGTTIVGDNKLTAADKKSSKLTYEYDPSTIVSPRTRAVYRTLDGWAQQLSVAATSYIPFVSYSGMAAVTPDGPSTKPSNVVQQQWREYYWDRTADKNAIYFHPSEAGKTVLVSYRDFLGKESTAVLGIDERIDASPSSYFGAKVAKLTLVDANGDKVDAYAITGIQGLSIQARTAWIESGRYVQAVSTDFRKS